MLVQNGHNPMICWLHTTDFFFIECFYLKSTSLEKKSILSSTPRSYFWTKYWK